MPTGDDLLHAPMPCDHNAKPPRMSHHTRASGLTDAAGEDHHVQENHAPHICGLIRCGGGRRGPWFQAGVGAGLSGTSGDRDRALGRRRRHRRDRAHRRGAAGEGPRPAVQRGQPHRRLRRGRPFRDRDRTARRLHHRHADGGNLDDALAGAHRTGAQELHAAGADERGPARHPGQFRLALQDREGTRRRHQGRACRQVQSLRHRPGRHLASGAGRLDAGDGTCAEPRGLGAVERRCARDAGSRRRRTRPHHLLGAGSARHHRGRQGAQPCLMAPANATRPFPTCRR